MIDEFSSSFPHHVSLARAQCHRADSRLMQFSEGGRLFGVFEKTSPEKGRISALHCSNHITTIKMGKKLILARAKTNLKLIHS